MSITLTEIAAKEVMTLIDQQVESAEKNNEDTKKLFLRVGVKGGGCSGFSYSLDLTESSREDDDCTNQHGVNVICDSKSLIYLDGTTVDFKDEMMGRGFVFNNPNATSSCGCGSSFDV